MVADHETKHILNNEREGLMRQYGKLEGSGVAWTSHFSYHSDKNKGYRIEHVSHEHSSTKDVGVLSDRFCIFSIIL